MAHEHLKSGYRATLWVFALINVAIFWSVVVIRDISNVSAVFSAISARDATFAVIGPIIILMLGGLISATNKARAIYWRYTYPLPGCFAFTRYLASEHRADSKMLSEKWGELPSDPGEQNQLWYKMYRNVEEDVRIHETHRDSLFSRDLTGYAVIFLIVFGLSALFTTLSWPFTGIYIGFLIVQYTILMVAARIYGTRLVCNVLALESTNKDSIL